MSKQSSAQIHAVITELSNQLHQRKLTLVTIESCTGGGIAFAISCSEECSALLERGYVVYSNQAKQDLVGVKPITLQTHGAVSQAVVCEMAEGGLKQSAAQISLATTGIGGSDCEANAEHSQKGILWVGVATADQKTQSKKFLIPGLRKQFIEESMLIAMHYLLESLK